jgi:ribose transport system permease protein
LAALVVLCLGFGVADPSFATFENLQTIASRAAIPVIIAVGMTFIIIQGSIDLSIEGVMAATSLTFAMSVLNTRTKLDLGLGGVLLGVLVPLHRGLDGFKLNGGLGGPRARPESQCCARRPGSA